MRNAWLEWTLEANLIVCLACASQALSADTIQTLQRLFQLELSSQPSQPPPSGSPAAGTASAPESSSADVLQTPLVRVLFLLLHEWLQFYTFGEDPLPLNSTGNMEGRSECTGQGLSHGKQATDEHLSEHREEHSSLGHSHWQQVMSDVSAAQILHLLELVPMPDTHVLCEKARVVLDLKAREGKSLF